jgi:hypothetical protein
MVVLAAIHITNLNPRQAQTIDYIFLASVTGQSLEFSYHLPRLYDAEMKEAVSMHK